MSPGGFTSGATADSAAPEAPDPDEVAAGEAVSAEVAAWDGTSDCFALQPEKTRIVATAMENRIDTLR